MHRLKCSEVWGGIKNTDLDACSAGMAVSLYSSACDGGRGGDVYYVTVCGADMLTRLVLADVVGHGQQVSQVSQWVYGQMAERMDDPDHSAILTNLNDRIAARGLGAMTTAVVVTYFLAERRLFFCYAGHPPMLSCQGDGPWRELMLPPSDRQANMPLGVEPGSSYDIGDVTLAKGDRLFLFSDGVVETRNQEDEVFGVERLRDALTSASGTDPMTLKKHVLSKLRQWSAGILDHDDVTMIAIELC